MRKESALGFERRRLVRLGDICHSIHLRSLSLEMVWVLKWKGQKEKSMMHLPSDLGRIKEHIKQANYLAFIQCHPERNKEFISHYCSLYSKHDDAPVQTNLNCLYN